jgi:hypothetical protein
MYLYKRHDFWAFQGDIVTHLIAPKHGSIRPERIDSITEKVGEWRKANAIHAWFVANVQNGVDDCHEYECSPDQLRTLLELVNTVLKDPTKGPDLLPTQGGFFFGPISYDEFYLDDLKDTRDMLALELSQERLCGEPNVYFVYRSSW